MMRRWSPIRLFFLWTLIGTYSIAKATAVPIVCTSSNEYVGYDGQWSPITIRVGNPEQWLSVLPSTLSQETWLIGPASCDGTVACQEARGGLFYSNESSTFQELGFYVLGYDPELGNSQFGYYGLDTISLNDDAFEDDQIIALLNTSGVWLGQMGLGVQQTRINGSQNRLPLLSSLVQSGSIPSNSYGYTAGAAYRLKGVPASLVLGGVDSSRFAPNNLSFTLNSDYAPVVAVNAIDVSSSADDLPSNWNVNPVSLLDASAADVFTIDSSTPYLWLPEAVCDNFATALNLTYNETLDLYVFGNDSSPDDLASWNLTFTFKLGNLPGSTESVELTVPYGAFSLELSYGFPDFDGQYGSPPFAYFPLRRSADNTQYILGRAFLQETYLTVDYERNSFAVSQAVITEDSINTVNLSAIIRPADSIFPGPLSADSGLSTGAKAGIGVGAGLGALIIAGLVWFFIHQRRTRAKHPMSGEKPKHRSLFNRQPKSPGSNTTVSELLGDKRHPTEIPADSTTSRFELPGSAPLEMPAAEVSPTFFQNPESRSDTLLRNDPRNPIEMGQQQTAAQDKEAEAAAARSERSTSPVPPYSPGQPQRNSNSISPYSARHSQAFGTHSSGEQGISPVGGSSGNDSHRNSNSVPSPISPETTMPRGFRRDVEPSEPSSTESSYGQHLTAQVPGRVPSRTPSRSSRFVEEGLDETNNSSSRSARFSWEE